jgi:hypothetical protein
MDQIKQYNKKYYCENKSKIMAKLMEKEGCKICGRMVSHQNIPRHMKLERCKTIDNLNKALNPVIDDKV